MKNKKIRDRKAYFALALAVLVFAGVVVWAATDKTGGWHPSSQVKVAVMGVEKSIQEAIDSDFCRSDGTNCPDFGGEMTDSKMVYPGYAYTEGIEVVNGLIFGTGMSWDIEDHSNANYLDFNMIVPEGMHNGISYIKLYFEPAVSGTADVVFDVQTAKIGAYAVRFDQYVEAFPVLGGQLNIIEINPEAFSITNSILNEGDMFTVRVERDGDSTEDTYGGNIHLHKIEVGFSSEPPCVPITDCGSVECGLRGDGCGGSFNCGDCGVGASCYSGVCYVDSGGGGGCFLEGTKITMADKNLKNIEDIKVGEFVLSFDEEKQEYVMSEVKETIAHTEENTYGWEKGYYILKAGSGEMKVTGNHLIYSKKGYVRVDSLLERDYVFVGDHWIKVRSLIYHEKDLDVVYNLELTYPNNYYAEGILVHNLKALGPCEGDTC